MRSSCALLALLTVGACRPAPRPNLVLISIDALRADRLAPYGAPQASSPNLAAWARQRAVICDNARTQAPWTLPAHTSLLTGLDPLRHGANWPYRPAAGQLDTLAERLRAAGYATAAITGGGWLDATFGLAQGFERFEAERDPQGRGDREWERHARLAAEWVRTLPQPFFLFVHTYDVHDFPRATRLPPDTPDGERARLYALAVRHMDDQLGLLLAELDSPRVRKRTAIVLTADHGEALGEQRDYGHGSLREPVLRVPLLIQPAGAPQGEGRRLGSLVRHIDIAPTFLEWAGVGDEGSLDGRSLVPRLKSPAQPGPSTSMAYFPVGRGLALLDGRLKYLVDDSAYASSVPSEAFYDLASDPEERQPLVSDRREVALRVQALELLRHGLQGLELTVDTPRGRGGLVLGLQGAAMRAGFARRLDLETPRLERTGDDAARWTLPDGARATLVLAVLQEGQLTVSTGAERLSIDISGLSTPQTYSLAGASLRAAWRGQPAPPAPAPAPEVAERLRALGYLR